MSGEACPARGGGRGLRAFAEFTSSQSTPIAILATRAKSTDIVPGHHGWPRVRRASYANRRSFRRLQLQLADQHDESRAASVMASKLETGERKHGVIEHIARLLHFLRRWCDAEILKPILLQLLPHLLTPLPTMSPLPCQVRREYVPQKHLYGDAQVGCNRGRVKQVMAIALLLHALATVRYSSD